ncbi:hypothetical protein RGQ29_006821 [Quercus rubra]|uniref:Uncharacterized protein n=1 Tax=Quercus rubra TaxID=3512 RepID=A0AAN7E8C3_QUERU|nr:hypothetical protein RGQ29_006821 [Quercus rubra]
MESSSFETVICICRSVEFPTDRLFEEILRVLKPCGTILVHKNPQSTVGETDKHLNLSGDLQELDLSFNYISGSIPSSFSQLPLVILSLSGNRLSGEIPKGIGEIGSLEELVLEANQLDGHLPKNLGNLSNLKRLHAL